MNSETTSAGNAGSGKSSGVISFFPRGGGNYVRLTAGQAREIAKAERLDMSAGGCKWPCPKCRNRVGCRQPTGHKGKPVEWGCRLYSDYTDKDYFKGHACKLFERGSWDGLCWS